MPGGSTAGTYKMEKRSPIQHRMTRRAAAHDYTRPGLYHITLHVADGLGQPLGAVTGSLSAPDGSADAPHTALSPVGQMVEHELLTAIHDHYPMVTIQDYVIMPEHLHCLVAVEDEIISQHGKHLPLGQVIAGFKKGCNKRYWEMTGNSDGETAAHTAPTGHAGIAGGNAGEIAGGNAGEIAGGQAAHTAPSAASVPSAIVAAASVPSGFPAGYKVPSSGSTARQPLFAPGYCDVMPVDAAQLATQRAYIAGNPRSRLQRMSHRALLTVQRGAITTALTPAALRGYLQRECPPYQATPEALATIEGRLLMAGGFIVCDTFGDRALLTAHRCLPVVCHRKDAARFSEQKTRCLTEAARDAALVGTRIAPKEREIMDDAVTHGFPVITLHDNGFADRYHPSADRLDQCMAGRLLIVTPWKYQYRGKNEQVTVLLCKTMNCVAQALCRTRDDWWK